MKLGTCRSNAAIARRNVRGIALLNSVTIALEMKKRCDLGRTVISGNSVTWRVD